MKNADKLDEIIASLKEEAVDTLVAWLRIPSVKDAAQPNAPFGAAIRRALDRALLDCARLGFSTHDFEGYAAHADLGEGDDAEALAILAHLDVVPEGDGWHYSPYAATLANGRLYARGASDDKGPAVAALYAMKAVQLARIPLRRKVRLILGCDEESGWEDIAYYQEHAVMPRSGFSPDASYPIINVEKGICRVSLRAALAENGLKVLSFHTGERPNVIPGKATVLLEGGDELLMQAKNAAESLSIPLEACKTKDGVQLTVSGIPGHAAYPQGAKNAIGEMLALLQALGVQGALRTLAERIGMQYNGASLGIQVSDGISGALTCNLGIIRADAQGVYATLDIRYPIMTNTDRLVENLRSSLPDFTVSVDEIKEPHYVPESSELVQSLLDAYHEVTGYERKCLFTGGGTYARALEEGVAFGASFPQSEDLAHQANEYIDLEEFFLNIKIFASAIVKLAGKA